MITQTPVEVINPLYDIKPVEFYKLGVRKIPDGWKHRVFPQFVSRIMKLHPHWDLQKSVVCYG